MNPTRRVPLCSDIRKDRYMKRYIPIAAIGCLAIVAGAIVACTAAQQAQAITIAEDAMPCYTAVSVATQAQKGVLPNAIAVSTAIASTAACQQLTAEGVSLITSALTTGATPLVAPAAAGVSMKRKA
jgi:hypothetical protein